MQDQAIIVTDNLLDQDMGKTAHGLITGMSRYPIAAVVDAKNAGKDAGEVVDGKTRNIPIYASVKEAIARLGYQPTYCIVGIATPGGRITPTLEETLSTAIQAGLHIVNGLHELICEHPILKPLVDKYQVKVIDIRKPKSARELKSWHGAIYQVKTPRIAVMGTDCAIGKRTTCQLLYTRCRENDIHAEMIYTGQTGWLQGFKYGFILDSTLNDFVSGELENAIVTCENETRPAVIFIEGQSALRNPSGPCGAEYLCSARAKGVILQHTVGRSFYKHQDNLSPMPSLESEIALIQFYGAKVLAVTLNTSALSKESWQQAKSRIAKEINLPVVCPREEGVDALIPLVKTYIVKAPEF